MRLSATARQQTALQAVAEPRRRELLLLLRDNGELSVGDLAARVDVTQQAVSLHMKALEAAGLVAARREGTRHLYAVRPEGFRPIQEFVATFWSDQLGKLKDGPNSPMTASRPNFSSMRPPSGYSITSVSQSCGSLDRRFARLEANTGGAFSVDINGV